MLPVAGLIVSVKWRELYLKLPQIKELIHNKTVIYIIFSAQRYINWDTFVWYIMTFGTIQAWNSQKKSNQDQEKFNKAQIKITEQQKESERVISVINALPYQLNFLYKMFKNGFEDYLFSLEELKSYLIKNISALINNLNEITKVRILTQEEVRYLTRLNNKHSEIINSIIQSRAELNTLHFNFSRNWHLETIIKNGIKNNQKEYASFYEPYFVNEFIFANAHSKTMLSCRSETGIPLTLYDIMNNYIGPDPDDNPINWILVFQLQEKLKIISFLVKNIIQLGEYLNPSHPFYIKDQYKRYSLSLAIMNNERFGYFLSFYYLTKIIKINEDKIKEYCNIDFEKIYEEIKKLLEAEDAKIQINTIIEAKEKSLKYLESIINDIDELEKADRNISLNYYISDIEEFL